MRSNRILPPALALFAALVTASAVSQVSAAELRSASPRSAGLSAERLERLTELGETYVAEGRVAAIDIALARDGRIVHRSVAGTMGAGDARPLPEDAIWRIYSMSKPITAVAALMLYEEGAFQLKDPITKWLPELADLQVWTEDGLVPVEAPATMQQLMTHTAGFSYGFTGHPVDALYREAQLFSNPDLDAFVASVAELPLIAQPGAVWHYSVASSLLGTVVERISGMPFGEFLATRLFEPLDMVDTGFNVPDAKLDRVVTNHRWDAEAGALVPLVDGEGSSLAPTGNTLDWGGGALFSTTRDYLRFAEMLRRGGELDGERILSPKTVEFMTSNHLFAPGGGSGEAPTVAIGDAYAKGFGFGLGVAVTTSPAEAGIIGSAGEYTWGGAAGTIFWVDPVEEVVVVGMIQLMGSPWPLRAQLKVLANGALTELAGD